MLSITWWILEKSDLLVVFGVVAKKDLFFIRWFVSIQWCTIDPETMLFGKKRHGFKIVANFRIFSICQGQWKILQFSCYQFIASLVVMSPTSCTANLGHLGNPGTAKGTVAKELLHLIPGVPRSGADIWTSTPIWNTKAVDWKRLDARISTPRPRRVSADVFPLRFSDPNSNSLFAAPGGGKLHGCPTVFSWRTPSCHPASGPGNDPKIPLKNCQGSIYKSKWWCINVII